MLPYEKNRSTFPPHRSTAAPQNLPCPTPTPIDLWKKIPAQSRACRRCPPCLGQLRSKITKQKLNPPSFIRIRAAHCAAISVLSVLFRRHPLTAAYFVVPR